MNLDNLRTYIEKNHPIFNSDDIKEIAKVFEGFIKSEER